MKNAGGILLRRVLPGVSHRRMRIHWPQEVTLMSLIQVSNLTFAYDGCYDPIFENVSFQIDTNWRLGFTGPTRRGKTTFLNLLLGKFLHQGGISAPV